MALPEPNTEFLLHCKKLQEQNKLEELIIDDKMIGFDNRITRQQIIISQYCKQMKSDKAFELKQKTISKLSASSIFAQFTKYLKNNQLQQAEQLIQIFRDHCSGYNNKHVLTFNLGKIHAIQGDLLKSTFYCESLLKQTGDGSDYYTYEYLLLLISQDRMDEALRVSMRHMQDNSPKPKIQSIFIYILQQMYRNSPQTMSKNVNKYFHNRSLCLRNYYNLAHVVKRYSSDQGAQMFQNLHNVTKSKQQFQKLSIMAKINVLRIKEKMINRKNIQKKRKKQLILNCIEIYKQLEKSINFDEKIETQRKNLQNLLILVEEQIVQQQKQEEERLKKKQQEQKQLLEKSKLQNEKIKEIQQNRKQLLQKDKLAQNQQRFRLELKNNVIRNEGNYMTDLKSEDVSTAENFGQKSIQRSVETRRKNDKQKKLKFLLKKQRELQKFFSRLKLQPQGNTINVKLRQDRSFNTSTATTPRASEAEDNENFQREFEQRKRKVKITSESKQLEIVLKNYVQEWLAPTQKNYKIKNIENLKKFVLNLAKTEQKSDDEEKPQVFSETKRKVNLESVSSKTNLNTFRVKNNTTRRQFQKPISQSSKKKQHEQFSIRQIKSKEVQKLPKSSILKKQNQLFSVEQVPSKITKKQVKNTQQKQNSKPQLKSLEKKLQKIERKSQKTQKNDLKIRILKTQPINKDSELQNGNIQNKNKVISNKNGNNQSKIGNSQDNQIQHQKQSSQKQKISQKQEIPSKQKQKQKVLEKSKISQQKQIKQKQRISQKQKVLEKNEIQQKQKVLEKNETQQKNGIQQKNQTQQKQVKVEESESQEIKINVLRVGQQSEQLQNSEQEKGILEPQNQTQEIEPKEIQTKKIQAKQIKEKQIKDSEIKENEIQKEIAKEQMKKEIKEDKNEEKVVQQLQIINEKEKKTQEQSKQLQNKTTEQVGKNIELTENNQEKNDKIEGMDSSRVQVLVQENMEESINKELNQKPETNLKVDKIQENKKIEIDLEENKNNIQENVRDDKTQRIDDADQKSKKVVQINNKQEKVEEKEQAQIKQVTSENNKVQRTIFDQRQSQHITQTQSQQKQKSQIDQTKQIEEAKAEKHAEQVKQVKTASNQITVSIKSPMNQPKLEQSQKISLDLKEKDSDSHKQLLDSLKPVTMSLKSDKQRQNSRNRLFPQDEENPRQRRSPSSSKLLRFEIVEKQGSKKKDEEDDDDKNDSPKTIHVIIPESSQDDSQQNNPSIAAKKHPPKSIMKVHNEQKFSHKKTPSSQSDKKVSHNSQSSLKSSLKNSQRSLNNSQKSLQNSQKSPQNSCKNLGVQNLLQNVDQNFRQNTLKESFKFAQQNSKKEQNSLRNSQSSLKNEQTSLKSSLKNISQNALKHFEQSRLKIGEENSSINVDQGSMKNSLKNSLKNSSNSFENSPSNFPPTAIKVTAPQKVYQKMPKTLTEQSEPPQRPPLRQIFKDLLLKGEQLEQKGLREEAHEHYTQLYKKYKRQEEKQALLLKIAQNYQNMNLPDFAQKTYHKCTKLNSMEAFFRLGALQIKNNKIQEGIQNLEKANCIERENIKIQIKLVYAYSLLQATTDRALALANSILKRNPECIEALLMTSKILQKKGKLKQALDIALAIGQACGSPPTYHYIALLYLNDSNVSEAFKFLQKALEIQPDHVPSLIEIATILSQTNPEEAITILKNVLVMQPENQLAFARLGKIYETYQNNYSAALQIYQRGLEAVPSYENFLKIGDCHLKMGSLSDAYLNYKYALELRKTPQIFEKIAQVHELQLQQKKAVDAYSNALTELPNQPQNYQKRKNLLYKLGKISLSIQQFESAQNYLLEVAQMEESFDIFMMLGKACFGKGSYTEALRYYEQASTLQQQDNLELLECMAMCYDKMEEYLTSKEIYQRILAVDGKNVRCLNNLANIYLIMGKTSEAFYWFEYMLQTVPQSIDKRLRVVDIYATLGDWSKVEQHLAICYKQKENDIRVIQRMVNLYKQKRDMKQLNKFQKRLALIKASNNKN